MDEQRPEVPLPPLPPLTLRIAKNIAAIIAAKYLSENVLMDERMGPGSAMISRTLLALTAGIQMAGNSTETAKFKDLVAKTVDVCTLLSKSVEDDLAKFDPAPSEIEDLVVFYKSLVLALADIYPGQVPVPERMNADDFYALIAENRSRLLSVAGLGYKNK